jgi:site-specific DNA-methyltransferase (adenine-specific)
LKNGLCLPTPTTARSLTRRKAGTQEIDGRAFFKTGKFDNAKIIFQVKSGVVERRDIATLRGDMDRAEAALAVLIIVERPTSKMIAEAKSAGLYNHEDMGRSYDRTTIVTVKEIVEEGKRLEIPMSLEVLKAAQRATDDTQMELP